MTRALDPVPALFAAMARGDAAAAEALLPQARRAAPDHPGVQAAGLDLALMAATGLATKIGPVSADEGPVLDRGYDAAVEVLTSPHASPARRRMATPLILKLGGAAELARIGDFASLGREWALAGRHGMMLQQLPRVVTDADRVELVAQHRLATQAMEAAAAATPIRRPATGARTGPLRVGFLSADLRAHVGGAFAVPLFEHHDPRSVALFSYSTFTGPTDRIEPFFRARSTFRQIAGLSDAEAAQRIADDDLDVLVEIGATTGQNRLGILAWRPAPVQVSWMGYPHSVGLAAVDYIVLDPQLAPTQPVLLAEKPLLMPHSWLSMARLQFSQDEPIDPEPPQLRRGQVTFGVLNQPFKYSPACIAAWAGALKASPGSRLLFVRPECAAARMRENVVRAFAAEGVEAGRLVFEPVRAGYLPHYNAIDVCLDTLPLTGGTTTCESLWMGVPVVTQVGPAIYERLSASLLHNLGLDDLCATDAAGFAQIAATLAADVDRLGELRRGLRQRIADSPLGDGPGFARDFFALLGSALGRKV